jgi:hypothetical protein
MSMHDLVMFLIETEILEVEGLKVNITGLLNGKQLTDNEINAAQRLLRNQYPDIGGLQDTLLGRTPHMQSMILTGAACNCVQARWPSSEFRPRQAHRSCTSARTTGLLRTPLETTVAMRKSRC